jgi:paraquat-inducible protein B
MSKPANKTVIGLFVVVALALVIAAVVVLGSGKFFRNAPKAVMYFQGSVKGLSAGSAVAFRGVKVGTVTEIKMLLNPKDLSMIIPVYVEFDQGTLEATPGGAVSTAALRKSIKPRELFQDLIQRGLRAQLETQSIVTGQLMIALDFHPDKPAVLVGADPRVTEIPTIPTTLQQVAERLEKIPVDEIVAKLNDILGGLDKIVNSPEIAEMMKSVNAGVNDTRTLVKNIDKNIEPLAQRMVAISHDVEKLVESLQTQMGPLTASITKTSDEAAVTLKKAQATMGSIGDMAGEDSSVSYNLQKTLEEMSAAARSLRALADTMNQQPESLFFGKKKLGGK